MIGALVAMALALCVIGVGAIAMVTGVVSEKAGDGCVLIACAAGTLVGSRIAVRRRKKNALFTAAGVATMVAMVLAVSGVLFYGEVSVGRCFVVGGACLCGGGLAGVIGGGEGSKRRV